MMINLYLSKRILTESPSWLTSDSQHLKVEVEEELYQRLMFEDTADSPYKMSILDHLLLVKEELRPSQPEWRLSALWGTLIPLKVRSSCVLLLGVQPDNAYFLLWNWFMSQGIPAKKVKWRGYTEVCHTCLWVSSSLNGEHCDHADLLGMTAEERSCIDLLINISSYNFDGNSSLLQILWGYKVSFSLIFSIVFGIQTSNE